MLDVPQADHSEKQRCPAREGPHQREAVSTVRMPRHALAVQREEPLFVRHERTHPGENQKPYACSMRPKLFAKSGWSSGNCSARSDPHGREALRGVDVPQANNWSNAKRKNGHSLEKTNLIKSDTVHALQSSSQGPPTGRGGNPRPSPGDLGVPFSLKRFGDKRAVPRPVGEDLQGCSIYLMRSRTAGGGH